MKGENMTRLINADAIEYYRSTVYAFGAELFKADTVSKETIDNMPTIDAVPVRHGKWKWLSCTYDRVPKEKEYECSECHHKTIVHGDDMPWENYCPNCGAKMGAENE